jgi:hypothetical protein
MDTCLSRNCFKVSMVAGVNRGFILSALTTKIKCTLSTITTGYGPSDSIGSDINYYNKYLLPFSPETFVLSSAV